MGMAISLNDARDLEWYLGEGMCVFWRSTFGPMLERQHNLAKDHRGNWIPKSKVDSWLTVAISPTQHEPSYTPSDEALSRFARVSRILREIEHTDPTSVRVLEAYYGDVGCRWGASDIGRIASVYPITKSGGMVVKAARAKYPTSADVKDDELIATDLYAQKQTPQDVRRARHTRMRDEADIHVLKANLAWKATAMMIERRRGKPGLAKVGP
jgi:hypothetical protein